MPAAAKGSTADEQRASVVAQRCHKDLGLGCRAAVDEQSDRSGKFVRGIADETDTLFRLGVIERDNACVGRQEQSRALQRRVERAAGIVAEIEDQTLTLLAVQK